MRRAAAAVLFAVVAALLAGCGSAKDARRHDVNSYVERVNALERQVGAAWSRSTLAYEQLGRGRPTPKELRAVTAAPGTIESLRRSIAAVDPPPVAAPLRRSLLALLDAEAAVARELARFGTYVRASGVVEGALAADTNRLHKQLAHTHARPAEERALATYAAQLDALERRARTLQPPAALAPWNREEVTRIGALARGAAELRLGLLHADRALAAQGLAVLRASAAGARVTEADRAAIQAYDARLARIRRLAGIVARRQAELRQGLT